MVPNIMSMKKKRIMTSNIMGSEFKIVETKLGQLPARLGMLGI